MEITIWAVAIEFIKSNIKYKNYKSKTLYMKAYRFFIQIQFNYKDRFTYWAKTSSKFYIKLIFFYTVITTRKLYNKIKKTY